MAPTDFRSVGAPREKEITAGEVCSMLEFDGSTMICEALIVLVVNPSTKTSSPTFSELLDIDFGAWTRRTLTSRG